MEVFSICAQNTTQTVKCDRIYPLLTLHRFLTGADLCYLHVSCYLPATIYFKQRLPLIFSKQTLSPLPEQKSSEIKTHTKKQFSCGDGADVAVAVRSLLIIRKKAGLRAAWAVRMVQAGNNQQPRSSETNERRNNEAAGINRRSLTKNRDMVMKLQPSSSGRSGSE